MKNSHLLQICMPISKDLALSRVPRLRFASGMTRHSVDAGSYIPIRAFDAHSGNSSVLRTTGWQTSGNRLDQRCAHRWK